MLLVIGVLIIGAVVYASLASTPGFVHRKPTSVPTPTEEPSLTPTAAALPVNGDTTQDVIIVSVDTEKSEMVCFEPETDTYINLTYSGSTDIRSKFSQTISARLLERGQIAEISYDKADGKLYHLYLSNDFWYYEKPLSWKMDLNGRMMRVGSINYHIAADVPTFAPDGDYAPELLSNMDVINVIGKGTHVYGLELVYGHGTLYAMNEKDYIGGSLFVDNVYAGQITEGFKMSIREGEYEISYSLGELNGKQEIAMNRNGTVVVDMAPAVEQKTEYGYIDFNITPAGADLFIDNKYYAEHHGVKLAYGQHVAEISLQGYTTWTGLISVVSEQMDFNVSLAVYFVPTLTPTPTAEPFFEIPTPSPAENIPTPTPAADVTPWPSPTANPGELPTPTPAENPGETPTPTPAVNGDATPTPVPDVPTVETVLVWYPDSIITVDSVYAGRTDSAGEVSLSLTYGKHVIGVVKQVLDGMTPPKSYTIDVSEATPARIKLPTTD